MTTLPIFTIYYPKELRCLWVFKHAKFVDFSHHCTSSKYKWGYMSFREKNRKSCQSIWTFQTQPLHCNKYSSLLEVKRSIASNWPLKACFQSFCTNRIPRKLCWVETLQSFEKQSVKCYWDANKAANSLILHNKSLDKWQKIKNLFILTTWNVWIVPL